MIQLNPGLNLLLARSAISYRKVAVGDGPALFEVFLSAIEGLAAGCYSEEQRRAWASRNSPSRLETRLRRTVTWVALDGSRLIGFGSLDARHGELDYLYVHPDFSCQGIGRGLTELIEEAAMVRGITRLELTASLNALPVYERLGYVKIADISKVIDGVSVPCIRMGKNLMLSPR